MDNNQAVNQEFNNLVLGFDLENQNNENVSVFDFIEYVIAKIEGVDN